MSEAGSWPSDDGRRHLAVIGGGQSAKWLLFGLAERLARGDRCLADLRISVFERGWEFGTGFAWSRQNTLAEHETSLAEPIGRVAFGDAQSRQFHETVSMLRAQGVVVDLRRGTEIVALRRDGGALHATIAGGDTVRADAVVLATGHWRPDDPLEGAAGYSASPWPAAALQEAVCGPWMRAGAQTSKRILILGTYLNALDAVISLSHRVGTFSEDALGRLAFRGPERFRLVMGSRRGGLPRVWGRAPSLRPPQVLTPAALQALCGAAVGDGFLPLDGCIDLLEREIAIEEGVPSTFRFARDAGDATYRRAGPTTQVSRRRLASDLRAVFARGTVSHRYADTIEVPWQVALFSVLPVFSEFSHALSAEDQDAFDERLRTTFFHHAMPMTLSTARKLEALMASGHLQVTALGDRYACVPNGRGVVLSHPAMEGRQASGEFTDVVMAHAGSGDIRRHPAPLYRDALRFGVVQPATRVFRDARCAERVAMRRGNEAIVERGRRHSLVVGGVEVDAATRRVIGIDRESGAANAALIFAMGPLLIGQFLDAHSIGQLIRDSGCILDTLASTQERTAS